MDFRNFTIKKLESNYANGYVYDVFFTHSPEIKKDDELTISDHLNLQVQKGSENLYLTLSVYKVKEYEEFEIYVYTKDNHKRLKSLIIEIIKQA